MGEKSLLAHCNDCFGDRNHILLYKESQPWENEVSIDYSIHGCDTFSMVKCCGCDSVKLMHTSWFSEICDEDGQPLTEVNYYPPAISKPEPSWLLDLDSPFALEQHRYMAGLMREIYSALHNDSRMLAVMGIRALIEYLMVSEVGDKGTFTKNLAAFQDSGYLSKRQREMIESILEAGHAAIHRGYYPNSEDVITVVEITESLVESIYVHSEKASKLKARVPSREK